jgi:hypothetical protein
MKLLFAWIHGIVVQLAGNTEERLVEEVTHALLKSSRIVSTSLLSAVHMA